MNDRALRGIVDGLGGAANGAPREDGFDITVASEVMAVFCLARDLADLAGPARPHAGRAPARRRAVTARDLEAVGAMTALLRDAFAPNLVQTLEGSPALIHGGPFANIAHGCNSVMATRLGLKLADIVVTEAGFGADLGGEKFFDIKCRSAGLGALLPRGGRDGAGAENAWRRGEVRSRPGERRGRRGRRRQPRATCREHAQIRPAGGGRAEPFTSDTEAEIAAVRAAMAQRGVRPCFARTGPMAPPALPISRAQSWSRSTRARPASRHSIRTP